MVSESDPICMTTFNVAGAPDRSDTRCTFFLKPGLALATSYSPGGRPVSWKRPSSPVRIWGLGPPGTSTRTTSTTTSGTVLPEASSTVPDSAVADAGSACWRGAAAGAGGAAVDACATEACAEGSTWTARPARRAESSPARARRQSPARNAGKQGSDQSVNPAWRELSSRNSTAEPSSRREAVNGSEPARTSARRRGHGPHSREPPCPRSGQRRRTLARPSGGGGDTQARSAG